MPIFSVAESRFRARTIEFTQPWIFNILKNDVTLGCIQPHREV